MSKDKHGICHRHVVPGHVNSDHIFAVGVLDTDRCRTPAGACRMCPALSYFVLFVSCLALFLLLSP